MTFEYLGDMRSFLFLIFFVLFTALSYGQKAVDKTVSIKIENKSLISILYDLSTNYNIDFYFDPSDLPVYALEGDFKDVQLYKVLQYFTNGSNLITIPSGKDAVILAHKDKANVEYVNYLKESWAKGEMSYPFVDEVKVYDYQFGNKISDSKNNILRISLIDEVSGLPIVGSVIQNEDLSVTNASDASGNITLKNLSGTYKFIITYIGYHSVELNIEVFKDGEIEIPMSVQNVILSEIEIVGTSARGKLDDVKVGAEVINMQKIERIPQALGEIDIIKSLEILPGVTSVGDISSGFNVRGGNVDESLVLFNDGMIFNPTHIVGFISAFNAESINKTTLYKGYVDGEFGNRSSAILDITADAENVKSFKGSGGIGTSMLKLYFEDKLSSKLKYKLSARGSFNDYLLGLIANIKIQRSNASFYDLNSSISYDLTEKQTIIFNTYNSDDFFEFNDEFGFEWQNSHVGLKLKSQWANNLFSKVSLNKGSYKSKQFTINSPLASDFLSGVNYLKLLGNLSYQIQDKGFVKAGVELIDYDTDDDALIPREGSTLVSTKIKRKSSQVIAPFLTFNFKIVEMLTLETSVRYSNYFSKGPGRIFLYNNDELLENNIESSTELNGRDSEGTHAILEPRLSLNFKVDDNLSIRAGYNKMSQNVLQITTSSSALPTDFWVFSDRYLPPQEVNQYSIGLFKTNDEGAYNLSFEAFSKRFNNLRSLRQFPEVILNEHIETELLISEGNSYGVEILVEKNKGRWQGSLAYTFSRSFRETNDISGSLNNDERFPADFDIPHQLNLVASYRWLPTVSLQFAYVYKTGRPTTLPEATIEQDGFLIPIYSGRNQTRIPHYSRFDFSITLDMRKAKQSGFRNSFNLGFYNALGRKNAFNVFFRRSNGGNIQPFQFSIIGTLVPNFTWNFTF